MKRWLRSWYLFFRAVWMVKTKDHGAGSGTWKFALLAGRGVRYIVYGQFQRIDLQDKEKI